MKGLIRKDLYMLAKYGKTYLLITVIFLAAYVMGNSSFFFFGYPTLMVSMWGITLMSYDERSHWDLYCNSLPVTRAQVVTSKYLLVGGMIVACVIVTTAVSFIFAGRIGTTPSAVLLSSSMLLGIGLISSALISPLVFKMGTEKARWAALLEICIAMVLFFGAGFLFFEDFFGSAAYSTEVPTQLMALFAPVGIVLYVISWLVSVRLYQNREL